MPNTIRSEGRLIIPATDYNAWLLTQLKPATGTFVSFSTTRVVGDRLETLFATATDFQPGPPEWPPE